MPLRPLTPNREHETDVSVQVVAVEGTSNPGITKYFAGGLHWPVMIQKVKARVHVAKRERLQS